MKRCRASALIGTCLALGLSPLRALAHAQSSTTVQFDREIVHVLDNHCVMCHAQDAPAFPLITYEQTYAARWQIRRDALTRHMAPWAAVPGYGDFVNDNALTQREVDFLVSWAESFGPRNNGAVYTGVAADLAAPKAVQAHTQFGRWSLGTPDLLLPLTAKLIGAQQPQVVQVTVIDPKLKAERWLSALEYQPGNRRMVHAVIFRIQETGQWLGGWTPWRGFADLPQGLAYRLPPGAHISAEIHYYGSGESLVDTGSLALHFADQPSARPVSDLVLDARPAAGAAGGMQTLRAVQTLDSDWTVLALQPTLHPGVQSIEVSARTPDGATRILLFANEIPLAWPTPYVLRNAVSLPQGTELSVIGHFIGDVPGAADGMRVTLSGYGGAALPILAPPMLPTAPVATAATQRFKLTGTVQSVDAANGRLVVQHGDIPGFMGAMTMTYRVAKHEDLRKIAAGDQIQSDVVSSDTDTYLENIAVTRAAR